MNTVEAKLKTILVIEDERPLNAAIKMKLESRGFRVFTALLAEEGFEILKKENIDLVWLDLRLPKMSGLEFLELLRNDPALKDKKVVVVSVSASEESERRARELGIEDYIIKSGFKFEDIIQRVSEKA